jgi:hypothetical protein
MNVQYKKIVLVMLVTLFYKSTISVDNGNSELSQAILASDIKTVQRLLKSCPPFAIAERQSLMKLSEEALSDSKKKLGWDNINTGAGIALVAGSILSTVLATRERVYVFDSGAGVSKEDDSHTFWHYVMFKNNGRTYKNHTQKGNQKKYISFVHGLIVRGVLGIIGVCKLYEGLARYKSHRNALQIKKLLENH